MSYSYLISASIVLYKPNMEQVKCVIESFSPSENRLLYLVDNSPKQTDVTSILAVNNHIQYYFMKKNMGYGTAHNVAIKMAMQTGAQYHVVLNPDLKFEPDIIDKIAEFMDSNHDIVEVMPKVFYPDGEIQYLCKLLPTPFNLIFRRFIFKFKFVQKTDDQYILKDTNYDKILNVPSLSGCFMFLCMALLKQYNLLFDERFHIYCEDVDFVRRLHKIGKTIYYPEVSIVHNHAKKSYQSKRMLFQHIKSAIQYFNKWGWFFDEERERVNSQVLNEIKRLSLNESEIKTNYEYYPPPPPHTISNEVNISQCR